MLNTEFDEVLNVQIKRCIDILGGKASEYAIDTDRLHNFKVAASLQGITVRQAVAGLMAKHTVSVYDMCRSQGTFVMDIWDEKITDHLNYLILLKAVLVEEAEESASFPLPGEHNFNQPELKG